ncbi:hypothetical protein HHK36_028521 [Tetracentron sinense]|uniref:AIPP2-like SPOC-like domain-containing protein n=1 Tax=Tetracentron sinense TaxID=13715 RepID=A0A835D0J2_TETSI|nr:hypothetical protein HHK36_028521 [Tetracentron sinense]
MDAQKANLTNSAFSATKKRRIVKRANIAGWNFWQELRYLVKSGIEGEVKEGPGKIPQCRLEAFLALANILTSISHTRLKRCKRDEDFASCTELNDTLPYKKAKSKMTPTDAPQGVVIRENASVRPSGGPSPLIPSVHDLDNHGKLEYPEKSENEGEVIEGPGKTHLLVPAGGKTSIRALCNKAKTVRVGKDGGFFYQEKQSWFTEITPVLKGNCRIQGPVDETDNGNGIQTNSGSSRSEKRFPRRFGCGEVRVRAESGTCNVCASPCSSCMHFNLPVSRMGLKTDEFSDEACRGKTDSQCSFNDAGVLSLFQSRACKGQQHTASETSNLLCTSSSHDLFTENAESKATLRMIDTAEDIEMLPKVVSGKTGAEDQRLVKLQRAADQIAFSNLYQEQKALECHGDNISCVSGVNDTNMLVGDNNRDVDMKTVSYSSASVSSFHPGLEKEGHNQSASGCVANFHCEVEESGNYSRRQSTFIKESIEKKHSNIGSATAVHSHKSPSSKDVYAGISSPKVRSPYSQSRSGKSLFCIADAEDLQEISCSHLLGEPSECSNEHVESSLAKVVASNSYGGQKSAAHECANILPKLENSKASIARNSSSRDSKKIYPCLEAETDMDGGDPPSESVKCSNRNEQLEKYSVSLEVSSMQEPPLQSQHVDESDTSDIVEDDVKVCDICGDAGREYLLAICRRCNDGAEHIYCMQIMLDKVPEGDWLCEECKFKEETENQKQDEFETVLETLKGSSSNEKSKKSRDTGAFNSTLFMKDIKELGVDASSTNRVSSSPCVSAKKHVDDLEVASAPKRQALEKTNGSPNASNPSKKPVLSRDSSFKNMHKGKLKPSYQMPSFGSRSVNNTLDTAHSPTTSGHNSARIQQRLQMSQCTLIKAHSFNTLNSKPKVKLVEEDVPRKKKMATETAASDTKKEGLVRMIGKSMSFKTPSLRHSNATEPKVKMLSSNFSRAEELKGLKQVKERHSFERKSSFKSDRSLVSLPMAGSSESTPKTDKIITSRGESMSYVYSASNYHDMKTVQPDEESNISSKLTSHLAHKYSEFRISSDGSGEVMRPVSCLSNAVGAPSPNGMCNSSAEQKQNQFSPKGEPTSSSSWTADKLCNNPDAIMLDCLPRFRESTNQDGNSMETSLSRSRLNVTMKARSIHCHKCKEVGHAAQFCPVGSPRVSFFEASAVRSSREVMNKINKLTNAIATSPLKRPIILKENRFPDQCNELSMTNIDLNCEVASNDQVSTSNCSRITIPMEGTYEGQGIIRSFNADSSKSPTVDDVNQHAVDPPEAVFSSKAGDTDSDIPSVGKPSMRDLPSIASAVTIPFRISPIPEHDYIWQGGYVVQRSGRLPDFYDGIQAHLSTWASPKVLEVVNKFPHNVLLEEVPRLRTWPTQFQDNYALEDNIALYFFPKDVESYERNYKSLLENMIKNDVAFKGNFDGIELLIFPSNQLPEKSQRWNMLFFLWGVFIERKINCSEQVSGSPKKPSMHSLNVVPLDQDLPTRVMSVSRKICKPRHMDKDLSASNKSCIVRQSSNSTASVELPLLSSSGIMDRNCDTKVSPLEAKCLDLQKEYYQQARGLDTYPLSRILTSDGQLCTEIKFANTSLNDAHRDPKSRQEEGELQPCVQATRQDSSPNKGEEKIPEQMNSSSDQVKAWRKMKEEEGLMDSKTVLERDPSRRDIMEKERDSRGFNSRNCPYSDYPDTDSQFSGETLTGTSPTIPWNEKIDCKLADGERDCKKMKRSFSETYGCNSSRDINPSSERIPFRIHVMGPGFLTKLADGESDCKKMERSFSGTYGCNSSRDINPSSERIPSRIHDLGPGFLTKEQGYDETHDAMVIPENLRTTERYFFPTDSSSVKNSRSRSNTTPWQVLSSDDEESTLPNLELALGAEKKLPKQGFLPFYVETVDKKNSQESPGPVSNKKEDDISVSLSLSLGFPFSDMEGTAKPVSKTEQLLPSGAV